VQNLVWADLPYDGEVMVQCSAHGTAVPAGFSDGAVRWQTPQRRVAPGQSVVLFDAANRYVLGGGICIR
jgi:tRNA-uridine 2-sulfurtransferase